MKGPGTMDKMDTYRKIDAIGHMLIWFYCAYLISALVGNHFFSAWLDAVRIWVAGFWAIGLLSALALGIWGRRTLKALNPRHREKKLHPYAVVSLACVALSFIQVGYIVYVNFHSGKGFAQYEVLNDAVFIIINLAALLTLLMSLHKAPVTGTHKSLGIGMSAFIFGLAGYSFGSTVIAIVLITAYMTGVVSPGRMGNYGIFMEGVFIISTLIIAAVFTSVLSKYRDYAIYQSV